MARKVKPKSAAAHRSSLKAKATAPKKVGVRSKRYSDAERQKILATAKREGMTGAEVRQRFGVSTLTFYTWRKRAGARRRKGSDRPRPAVGGDLVSQIREVVRARLREMLPGLIENEMSSMLSRRTTRRR